MSDRLTTIQNVCVCVCVCVCVNLCVLVSTCVCDVCLCPKSMSWQQQQQQQGPEPRALSAEPVYHRIPSNAVMSAHPLFDHSANSLSATMPSFLFREASSVFRSSFSSTGSNFSTSLSHESEGLRSPHGNEMFGSSFSSISSEVLPPAPLSGSLSRSLAQWHTFPRAHS